MKCMEVAVKSAAWRLIPLCCIHYPLGEKDLLHKWVEELKQPNTYGILLGDSMDEGRTHYRDFLRSYTADKNSQDAFFDYHRAQLRDLAKILKPVANRIWGVVLGNHYLEFQDGTNSEQYLCQLLGIPYIGVMGFIRVCVGDSSNNKKIMKIFVHHHGGSYGGKTASGDLAGLLRVADGRDADVYIVGHTHRKLHHKKPFLTITGNGEPTTVDHTRVFIRAGSLLKGFKHDDPDPFTPHRPSYSECGCLSPTELGWITLHVRLRRQEVTIGRERKRSAPTKLEYTVVD